MGYRKVNKSESRGISGNKKIEKGVKVLRKGLAGGRNSWRVAQNWKSTPLVHGASVAPEVQDALHYYIHGGRWLTVVQHPLHYLDRVIQY